MLRAHFLDTEHHQFAAEERDVIAAICRDVEPELRGHLPGLASHVHLVVEPGLQVIPETGEVGFTQAPHLIRWTVDPTRDVHDVAARHLRHVLFHEAHHATRLVRFPEEAYTVDWTGGAIFEGLATVFEADAGDFEPPWGQYDPDVIESWAHELLSQPVDETYRQWKFEHPDGRRWIAYRVGTYLARRAVERSGRSAAALVWEPLEVLEQLAEVSSRRG